MSATRLNEGDELGGCTVVAELGRGGMGVVYLADQPSLGRRVAIKVIASGEADDPAFRRRFMDESRAAASIDHPTVLPVYAAGEEEGLLSSLRAWSRARTSVRSAPWPAGT